MRVDETKISTWYLAKFYAMYAPCAIAEPPIKLSETSRKYKKYKNKKPDNINKKSSVWVSYCFYISSVAFSFCQHKNINRWIYRWRERGGRKKIKVKSNFKQPLTIDSGVLFCFILV